MEVVEEEIPRAHGLLLQQGPVKTPAKNVVSLPFLIVPHAI
jgi:hypothetical protein